MGEEGGMEYHVKIEGGEGREPLKNDYFLLSPPVSPSVFPFVLFSLADMGCRRLGSPTITVGVRIETGLRHANSRHYDPAGSVCSRMI